MARSGNFSAGPAMLPEGAREEMLDEGQKLADIEADRGAEWRRCRLQQLTVRHHPSF
jgi:hypothetical protein